MREERKSKVQEKEMLKTEQAGGIQSPSPPPQIKETFSLPGLLDLDTARSQTEAFISLQMGPTSPPWSMDRMQLRAPMGKTGYDSADIYRPLPLDPLEFPPREHSTNMHNY